MLNSKIHISTASNQPPFRRSIIDALYLNLGTSLSDTSYLYNLPNNKILCCLMEVLSIKYTFDGITWSTVKLSMLCRSEEIIVKAT